MSCPRVIAFASPAAIALLAMLFSACLTESRTSEDASAGNSVAGNSAPRHRPEGPAADVSETISGAMGPFIGTAPAAIQGEHYVEHEYIASGTATSYEPSGALSDDGHWTFERSTVADYRTRILVRRPARSTDSSGTVIVEWLNVSGGVDAHPEYISLAEEITRRGHTWVGVSAQRIGVEGGPPLVIGATTSDLAGKGLKTIDPARYGSLEHPGDGYAFDIFTQVARALLEDDEVLGGIEPTLLIAAGESQSALALTTYYNGVQPLTAAFDAFLVHSRAAISLPLVGDGRHVDVTASIVTLTRPLFRNDLDAPVLVLQAEGDVTGILNSSAVRQPDSDHLRLWEVAGTAHADAHLLGPSVHAFDCGAAINIGPMHVVAKAALSRLDTWARGGQPPPTAARLETIDLPIALIRRDRHGIALGGVRTPPVDVPVDVLSGEPAPTLDAACVLFGSTTPLSETRLRELYPTRTAYEQRYAVATDETISAGFVLEADRAALLKFAQPSRIGR